MVRWMKVAFEFDQTNKKPESKMQVTGKLSNND